MHRVISPDTKLRVAIDAIKGQMSLSQICSKHKVSQPQVGKLKKLAEQLFWLNLVRRKIEIQPS